MKIGVTGGAGFLGSYVCEAIEAAGNQVLVLDHHHEPRTQWPTLLGDVTDANVMYELAAHVDGIIHLAAVLGTQETIQAPLPSAHVNILGSLNIFEAASRYNLPVVYTSIGNHWMRLHGAGSYTISKAAAEDYARMYNSYRSGRVAIVRPVNAYGPRQSVAEPYGPSKIRKIMPAFICRALTDTPIEVYGDGEQISDCVYVADVAAVLVKALEHASRPEANLPAPVEVGPASSATVNQVADLVVKAVAEWTGQKVPIKHLPMRPGEVPGATVSADVSTLSALEVDADDFVPLDEGIRRTVAWFAEHWLPTWKPHAPIAEGIEVSG